MRNGCSGCLLMLGQVLDLVGYLLGIGISIFVVVTSFNMHGLWAALPTALILLFGYMLPTFFKVLLCGAVWIFWLAQVSNENPSGWENGMSQWMLVFGAIWASTLVLKIAMYAMLSPHERWLLKQGVSPRDFDDH